MKKYEAVFILDIRRTDDEGAAFCKEFSELIASLGGTLESTTPMGRRQFTYEIDKRKAGIYFDFVFELEILRNLIVIYDRPAATENAPVALNME